MRVRIWTCLGFGLGLLAGSLAAQATGNVEVSADDPITLDLNTQESVLTGNARFSDGNLIVEADEIRVNEKTQTVTATGNVRATRRGLRIVSERITYNYATKEFSSGPFRAGSPPLFVEGERFSGNLEEFDLEDSRFYYLEPEAASPALEVKSATIRPGGEVSGDGVHLDLPLLGGIPLPSFERSLTAPTLSVRGNAGFRNRLGGFVQSEILAPFGEDLRIGANLDLYTRRGVLIGPALRYTDRRGGDDLTRLSLSSGWIADQGGDSIRGLDVLGEAIPYHRYLSDLELHHREGDFEALLHTSFLSDSEVERDFRDDRFDAAPHPDSFFEMTQLLGDAFLSVFVERNPHTFFRNLERVPEITFEVPYQTVGELPLVQAIKMRYLRFRTWGYDPDTPSWDGSEFAWPEAVGLRFAPGENHWQDLGELTYSLRAPLKAGNWLAFTPVGELNTFVYQGADESGDESERRGTQLAGGFDLEATVHADFAVRSEIWDINRLRHVVQPVAQYRYFRRTGDAFPHDRFPSFRTTRPEIDFFSRRDRPDFGAHTHFLRTGLRNVIFARGESGDFRELAAIAVFHDATWVPGDGTSGLADSAAYLEFSAQPARWLELRYDHRLGLSDNDYDEARLRAIIRSAEAWELELAVDYYEGLYHQYRAEGAYQLSTDLTFLAGVRFDALRNDVTRQLYGLRFQIGQAWSLETAVVLRSGSQREDDVGVEVSLRLLDF